MENKMKKTFWIMWAWLLLASNVLMSFSNVTFACWSKITVPCSDQEAKWCYVFSHNYTYEKDQFIFCGVVGDDDNITSANNLNTTSVDDNYYVDDVYAGSCKDNPDSTYHGTTLVAYKCDAKWWVVDLRNAPLENGQFISSIWDNAFSWTNVTKVILPSTVEWIWNRAFCRAKNEWAPMCWNGIIEAWEECDGGNVIFRPYDMYANFMCNSECRRVPAPVCWNGVLERQEDCYSCPKDVEAEIEEYSCELCWNGVVDPKEDCNSCPYDVERNEWSCPASSSPSVWDNEPDEDEGYLDRKNFIELDFPAWINPNLNLDSLEYACAKLHEYTVTFKIEDWKIIWTWETIYQYVNPNDVPSAPEKEWYIWEWYLWDEPFDFDTLVENDITLIYKYKKWWIKVWRWDQEIIVKDRNQWDIDDTTVEDLKSYLTLQSIGESIDEYIYVLNEECKYDNDCVTEKELDYINKKLWTSFSDVESLEEYYMSFDEEYLNNLYKNVNWNFYFRWNNTWVSLDELELDDNGYVLNKDDLISKWFDGEKYWSEEGSWWIEWNNNNPCDWSKWEYLPTYQDWKKLLWIWGKLNGYELTGGNDENVFIDWIVGDNGLYNFLSDILISPSWYALEYYENMMDVASTNGRNYRWNWQDKNWEFWMGASDNTTVVVQHFNPGNSEKTSVYLDALALPVRCFIRPQFEVSFEVNGWTTIEMQKVFSWDNAIEPETQRENFEFLWWYTADWTKFVFTNSIKSDITLYAKWQENKPSSDSSSSSNNSYSGWGGWRWGSSKNTDTSDSHKAADTDNSSSIKSKDNEMVKDSVNSSVESKNDSIVSSLTEGDVSYVWNEWRDKNSSIKSPGEQTYSQEFQEAYNFAKSHWITTKSTIQEAKMNGDLTRIQMAKMLSYYAMNVLWQEPDSSRWVMKFKDVSNKLNKEYDNAVTLAYQLWIMWINMPNNKFRPYDEVPRAEITTALSRMIYGIKDWTWKTKYYEPHMAKMYNEWLITKRNPEMIEHRWYVMLMLMRSAK